MNEADQRTSWFSATTVDLVYSTVRATCARAGLRSEQREEVAQEVWLWLLRRGLPPPQSSAWLNAVTRNMLLRWRRRQHRLSSREAQAPERLDRAVAAGSVEELENQIALAQVATALSPLERRLLMLFLREGSLSEAASRLGIPKGSRTYLRKRLATRLRKAGFHRAGPSEGPSQTNAGKAARKIL